MEPAFVNVEIWESLSDETKNLLGGVVTFREKINSEGEPEWLYGNEEKSVTKHPTYRRIRNAGGKRRNFK